MSVNKQKESRITNLGPVLPLLVSTHQKKYKAVSYRVLCIVYEEIQEMLKQFARILDHRNLVSTLFITSRSATGYTLPFQDTASNAPEISFPKKKRGKILYVWGLGEHGALGHHIQKRKHMVGLNDPRFRTFNRPLRLTFGEVHTVTDIAAGFGFSVFAVKTKDNRKIYGTGINTDSQIGYHPRKGNSSISILLAPMPIKIPFENPQLTKITGLAAGRAHTVVCTDNGVYTFGNNAYGQCGRRIYENEKYENSNVVHYISSIDGVRIKSAECGQDHTLFLMENGTVYSCGWGADGQTGLGHYTNESYPTKVLGDIEGENIVKISSKSDCVLALNDKGEVFGWGNSEYCQLFDEDSVVQQINRPVHLTKCKGFGRIVDVAAAGSYCMMLNDEGEVYTWGYGILGRGPEASQSWRPEVIPAILFGRNQISPDVKVIAVYSGLNHCAAVTNRGEVYTWGKNKGSCLGLGHKNDQFFPLRVSFSAKCTKLSLGADHTLALCNQL